MKYMRREHRAESLGPNPTGDSGCVACKAERRIHVGAAGAYLQEFQYFFQKNRHMLRTAHSPPPCVPTWGDLKPLQLITCQLGQVGCIDRISLHATFKRLPMHYFHVPLRTQHHHFAGKLQLLA